MSNNLVNVESRIKELIVEHFDIEESIEEYDLEKDFFLDDFGVNSIDTLELLLKVEMEFGIEIEDEDLNADLLISLRNLATHVSKKIV